MPPTRRDRLRTATMEEITATARRLLGESGPEAASLRAIAREMGMTAPALYRYYSSREELLRHVVAETFRELAGDIRRAVAEADSFRGPGMAGRADPEWRRDQAALKMLVACRELRRWALGHREEFALLFGAPAPGLDGGRFDIAEECALEFGTIFYGLFLELWDAVRFPVPAPSEIHPGLRAQVGRCRDRLDPGTPAPDGAILVFLRCWVLFYGAVSVEVLGHLPLALDDPAPMFELTLSELARLVGLEYPLRRA